VVESFWTIPDVSTIRTPLSILREQASAITEQTKGALVGIVEAHTTGPRMDVQLDLSVPALNDYRYRVLSYRQPIELYPGFLIIDERYQKIADEKAFVEGIKEVLSSSEMAHIVGALLAQANQA
jgi:hypothetical protein